MRIAVDATCWHNRRGYGRHARALLRALVAMDSANRYTLFLDSTEEAEPLPSQCETRLLSPSQATVHAASANGRRSLKDMWRMSRALSDAAFDAVLFPTIYSFVPVFSRARKLVMVHDIIAETFPQLTVPRRSARLFWNAKVKLGLAQADAVITVSDYSREGILKHFRLAPARVFVVGEAPDPVFRKLEERGNVLPRNIVYVGGFSPHKNLEALVRAFARVSAQPEYADVRLTMVGATGGDAFHSYYGTIAAQVEAAGLSGRVAFPGFVPDAELVKVLNAAAMLVLPSLMEGYGLPAVEAAACGCPVIATRESPLEGLLGEGGIYIPPEEDALAAAMERVLASAELRARMGAAGLAAAGRLTWDNAAAQMMEVIRAVRPG